LEPARCAFGQKQPTAFLSDLCVSAVKKSSKTLEKLILGSEVMQLIVRKRFADQFFGLWGQRSKMDTVSGVGTTFLKGSGMAPDPEHAEFDKKTKWLE
jgi:hypothetical protein